MPYRRLPKTDASRQKALKTVIDNDDLYTVRLRVVDWKTLSKCKPVYERLSAAMERYKQCMEAQTRKTKHLDALRYRATMYLSHFLQVLFLAIDRGEIFEEYAALYGLVQGTDKLPNLKNVDTLLEWGPKIIEGEKQRIKKGGLPIFNPSIGKVSIHFEIYKDMLEEQRLLVTETTKALEDLQRLRPETDELIFDLWNQIEQYYGSLPSEERLDACRKLGVVYYYRRYENKEK